MEWHLLKPVFPAQAGIHGVEVHGKTMDSRLRGNDELLHLGLSKRHSGMGVFRIREEIRALHSVTH